MPEPQQTANGQPADEPTTPPAPDLAQRAEQAERQRDEFYRLLKLTQADYENAHQRTQREREQERQYRSAGLATDLLPALDNLERAMASAKEASDTGPLAQG